MNTRKKRVASHHMVELYLDNHQIISVPNSKKSPTNLDTGRQSQRLSLYNDKETNPVYTAKWVLTLSSEKIDDMWEEIKKAVDRDLIWGAEIARLADGKKDEFSLLIAEPDGNQINDLVKTYWYLTSINALSHSNFNFEFNDKKLDGSHIKTHISAIACILKDMEDNKNKNLINEISKYIDIYMKESASFIFNIYSLFSSIAGKPSMEAKLATAKKLISFLNGESFDQFTAEDIAYLKDGRLGAIMKRHPDKLNQIETLVGQSIALTK